MSQYPSQQYPHGHYQPEQPSRPALGTPPPKRRKVWPWVLLAVVMVPILGFVACTAMVGGAVKAVDDARQGGTVALGETFTYSGGIALSVSQPKAYKASSSAIVAKNEAAYEATVTITNGTKDPVGAALATMNATVNGAPAERVFDGSMPPTQDIAPGQALRVPFRFKVPKGTTGPLQIAVAANFNESVFFTGKL